MNNEIKEILEYLGDKDLYVEDFGYSYKRLSLHDSKLLLKYIKKLELAIIDTKATSFEIIVELLKEGVNNES